MRLYLLLTRGFLILLYRHIQPSFVQIWDSLAPTHLITTFQIKKNQANLASVLYSQSKSEMRAIFKKCSVLKVKLSTELITAAVLISTIPSLCCNGTINLKTASKCWSKCWTEKLLARSYLYPRTGTILIFALLHCSYVFAFLFKADKLLRCQCSILGNWDEVQRSLQLSYQIALKRKQRPHKRVMGCAFPNRQKNSATLLKLKPKELGEDFVSIN